jgi:hypothetical protein
MPFYIVRHLDTGRMRVARLDRAPVGRNIKAAGPYAKARLAWAALDRRDEGMLRQLFDNMEPVTPQGRQPVAGRRAAT